MDKYGVTRLYSVYVKSLILREKIVINGVNQRRGYMKSQKKILSIMLAVTMLLPMVMVVKLYLALMIRH